MRLTAPILATEPHPLAAYTNAAFMPKNSDGTRAEVDHRQHHVANEHPARQDVHVAYGDGERDQVGGDQHPRDWTVQQDHAGSQRAVESGILGPVRVLQRGADLERRRHQGDGDVDQQRGHRDRPRKSGVAPTGGAQQPAETNREDQESGEGGPR